MAKKRVTEQVDALYDAFVNLETVDDAVRFCAAITAVNAAVAAQCADDEEDTGPPRLLARWLVRT